jgi:hypothetical protein
MADVEVRKEVVVPPSVDPMVERKMLSSLVEMRKELAMKVRRQSQDMERIAKRASFRAMSYFQKANGFGLAAERMEACSTEGIHLAYMDVVGDSKINISMDRKTLLVYTKPIVLPYKLPTMSKSINVPVGKFELLIDMDKRSGLLQCYIKNLTSRARCNQDQMHPHVNRDASICWGDGQVQANKFMAESNFVGVLDMMLYTLTHYNEGNPFVRLLRGWSWNMPLLERVCWSCSLPVDKDNIYKIPTICQCAGRYTCCHQHQDDGHDPQCETRKRPPVPPRGTTATPPDMEAWIHDTQERLARMVGGQQEPLPAPVLIPTPIPDIVVRAEPSPPLTNTMIGRASVSIIPSSAPTRLPYQFEMLDRIVEMDNNNFATPCQMMDAWVRGSARTINTTRVEGFDGECPRTVVSNDIRFTFTYDVAAQKVYLTYEGVDEGGIRTFTTTINFADMQRWVVRYHTR